MTAPAERRSRARNRASARAAGARFNGQVAAYLAVHLDDDRIERRAPSGAKDRGDVTGLRHMGGRVVVECKDEARVKVGPWLNEAETERGNDDALVALVVSKRHGIADLSQQPVLLTLGDLVALLTGTRPDD